MITLYDHIQELRREAHACRMTRRERTNLGFGGLGGGLSCPKLSFGGGGPPIGTIGIGTGPGGSGLYINGTGTAPTGYSLPNLPQGTF